MNTHTHTHILVEIETPQRAFEERRKRAHKINSTKIKASAEIKWLRRQQPQNGIIVEKNECKFINSRNEQIPYHHCLVIGCFNFDSLLDESLWFFFLGTWSLFSQQ